MTPPRREALVVIGNGTAGARAVEEILARAPDRFTITVFDAGPVATGARLLHRRASGGPRSLPWLDPDALRLHAPVRAERVDRTRRVVVGRPGSAAPSGTGRAFLLEEPYDRLVLATGSVPSVPPVEGLDKDGVLVWRTPEDVLALARRPGRCRRAAVLGGGRLALLAARALRADGAEVTVVDPAAELRRELEAAGVRVLPDQQPAAVLGDGAAAGLRFAGGSTLEADLVVVCAGQRPNAELAREAGLEVARAVVVDDQLRTSDPDVFALGGCAEHRGQVAGPADPLHEQARVLAEVVTGANPAARYAGPRPPNKIEVMKRQKDGLDALPDLLRHAQTGNWEEMTEDDKQRFKWQGLFFRKQTPGHFMLRIRLTGGATDARQFRVIAELSDRYGKGFCDLTTRQQVQMRWFAVGDVPEIWRRLGEVGLTSKQTGMDNVRGVCTCPLSGLGPHELFDAAPVARQLTELILDNRAYSNLPRKFNVTITGCLENCCHPETQDLALVPSYRELDGTQVNGFNVLAGGKQGSGGYTPAAALDVFVRPDEAAALCGHVVGIFRDHGARESRNRARLAFLIEDRGVAWMREELERRWGRPLDRAGPDLRKKHHTDHLGVQPQKPPRGHEGPPLFSVGLLVPVGRITTDQMRGVADLAERYGSGAIRLTVQQNLVIPNVPENRVGALTEEPLLRELPFDPSPILRGLVACTGIDYCHFALIETKSWAVQVARELERRTEGHKLAPLTIHWSGCAAGCGMHQAATIGLQGCRSRVHGQVVDAAHVYVDGRSGPDARVAKDLMYDVPCDQLADALLPLVKYLPRQ